jgi:protein SCO1
MSHSSSTLPQPATSWSSHISWYTVLYVTLGLLVTAVILFNIFQPITVLPRHNLAPGYALWGEREQLMTSEDNRGRITLYSFTYSQCAGESCPQSASHLAAVHRLLDEDPPEEIPVTLVTISLDPERDTAVVRQAYLNQYASDQATIPWHFLSGAPERVRQIVGGGFGIYYRAPSENEADQYEVYFEPRFILVDGLGIIRAEYRTPEIDPAILLRDVHFVAEEARRSTGAAKLAYEAAHLFMCYPR